jgi:hypothetical protein
MRPDPPPPNPDELEDRLARRSCPEPAADFRARVLAAMTDLRDAPAPVRPGRRWPRVWLAAAAVVLALNVGMSAANALRFRRLADVAAAPAEGRGVADAVDAEDRFQRFAARALAGVRPAPDAGVLGRNLFGKKEDGEWGTP